jgi:predicted ester cyclase
MSEQNKALFRRFINEVMNGKKVRLVGDLLAPNFVDHNLMPGQTPGAKGMEELMTTFFAAFPDLHASLDLLIAEGDLVVGRMTTTGTHRGEFMGIPATGKRVKMTEIHIVRIANGKAVEHWGNSDDVGLMQQLGVIPTPGQ